MYISHSSRCRHAFARVTFVDNVRENASLQGMVCLTPCLAPWSLTNNPKTSALILIVKMEEEELTLYYHPCPWASSSSFPLSTNPRQTWDPCFPSIYLDHHHEDDHMRSLLDLGLLVFDLTILIDLLYRFVESGVLC
jgi:hypothetical protein